MDGATRGRGGGGLRICASLAFLFLLGFLIGWDGMEDYIYGDSYIVPA